MGVSTVDLSHVRALALALSENKQLETAHAGGYYTDFVHITIDVLIDISVNVNKV